MDARMLSLSSSKPKALVMMPLSSSRYAPKQKLKRNRISFQSAPDLSAGRYSNGALLRTGVQGKSGGQGRFVHCQVEELPR